MDLQLELLPYHYYNTLGFDMELIDYVDHVDDSVVLDIVGPLYKRNGRRPVDPRTYFRMHYLYFMRSEITSFRELERQLKEPKIRHGEILLVFHPLMKFRVTEV